MLRKLVALTGVISFLIILTACPFSTTVPIDEGTAKIPTEIEGQWIGSADLEAENPSYFIISIEGKHSAAAIKMEYSDNDSSYVSTLYHLTFSNVGDEVFMNALADGEFNYNLYKFKYDDKTDQITTWEVSDYIKESFSTSKELKDFILKNKSNSYFFTNTVDNYVRKPL